MSDYPSKMAAFANGLSESEWRTPVSGSDRRPVGVIVHHVASVYPIEIDLARAIASGKAVTNVTWEVVAELNGKHAQENAEVTKVRFVDEYKRRSPNSRRRARPLPRKARFQQADYYRIARHATGNRA